MKKLCRALATLLVTAVPAFSQELPELGAYLDSVKSDIQASGSLAFGTDGRGLFLPEGERRTYTVQFAVNREILKDINENCIVNTYSISRSRMCMANISAEITFDGPSIELLVFEVSNLQHPQEK